MRPDGFTGREADGNAEKSGVPLAYDEDADRRSWQPMQDFFERVSAD